MALTPLNKRNYISNQTSVTAKNMNDIQDAITELQGKSLITDAQSLSDSDKTTAKGNLGIGYFGGNLAYNNTNIDNILTTGFYYVDGTHNGTMPDGIAGGYMIVESWSDVYVKQTVFAYKTHWVYTRYRKGTSSWSAWELLVLQQAGDTTVSLSSGYTASINTVTRRCGFVDLCLSATRATAPTAGQWNTIGTIPTGYRPNRRRDFVACDNERDDSFCYARIMTDGSVDVYSPSGKSISRPIINTTYWTGWQ